MSNTLGHENEHKESNGELTNLAHSQIVLNQISRETFAKGSTNYQTGTIKNLLSLMYEANKTRSNTNALVQIMVQANKIIKPLGLGKIVRRNNQFEYEEE